MTIVDADCVSPSNINRQLIALHSTIGAPKANILADRLRDINPDIELDVLQEFIKDDMTDTLLDRSHFDYIVDAIDTLAPKVNLIKANRSKADGCSVVGVPDGYDVYGGGAGRRLFPVFRLAGCQESLR